MILNNKVMSNKVISILLLVICLMLSVIFTIDNYNKDKYRDNLEASLLDSLHITRNSLNQEIASKRTIVATNAELKRLSRSNDKEIKRLSDLVTKNTQSATIIETHTEYIKLTKTDSIYIDKETNMPVYYDSYSDRWLTYIIMAGSDSIKLDLNVKNEYEIKQEWRRKNIFHRWYLNSEVNSLNPHTYTDKLISYSKRERSSRIGAGIFVGYGMSNKGLSPIIGVGLGYNIIKF